MARRRSLFELSSPRLVTVASRIFAATPSALTKFHPVAGRKAIRHTAAPKMYPSRMDMVRPISASAAVVAEKTATASCTVSPSWVW